MKAYVSLWSADLLAIGAAVDLVADQADGLHIDVFDGHRVPELLFGPDFVAALAAACRRTTRRPEIVVDGGIRRHTVPMLAAAGADGVVPGSLVFGDVDPRAAIEWIHDQRPARLGP